MVASPHLLMPQASPHGVPSTPAPDEVAALAGRVPWRPSRAARWAWILAAVLVLLALIQPVDTTGSDGAIQLLAAQAVADHGTLSLDVYRDDPRCAYALASDYRIVPTPRGLRYFVVGPPLLSAPFVFLARRLGLDMLDQAQEFALANVLSALLCGGSFLLLFAACRELLDDGAALALSVVSSFGSPLVSTFATGLWPAAYALVPLLLASRQIARHALGRAPWRPGWLALWLVIALLCRPASIFFWAGLLAYAVAHLLRAGRIVPPTRTRWWGLGLGASAVLVAALLVGRNTPGLLHALAAALPSYYSPLRLLPLTPWTEGLYGVLLSPGRGLLIYCPFIAVVLMATLARMRVAAREPLVWFSLAWAGTQLVATGLKTQWWGGSSFGPRQLAELLVPMALLASWLWRTRSVPSSPAHPWLARAYLAAGALALVMHSGQGLWNPAVQAWNRGPGRTLDPAVLFDWRYPQFLATEARVRARDLELQTRALRPLRPGDTIGAESTQAVFVDWHPVEGVLRRSGRESRLRFQAEGFDAAQEYALELRLAALREQRLELRLGDWSQSVQIAPPEPHTLRFLVPGRVLAQGLRELILTVPDAARASARDARVVGVALHAARFVSPSACPQVYFYSEGCALAGFADPEATGRWTRARQAALRFDVDEYARTAGLRLRLTLRSLGRQTVHVSVNGTPLATLALSGQQAESASLEIAGAWLLRGSNRLDLGLPDAHRLPTDERLLGVWLTALELQALEPGTRLVALSLGSEGDLPVPADYDGDGLTDLAVFTTRGTFLTRLSRSATLAEQPLGRWGDVPLARDFDGDGRADPAVWRPSTGELRVRSSHDGSVRAERWGRAGDDVLVSADYDGDGRADPAVYRAADNPASWWIQGSAAGLTIVPWGLPGDRSVRGDFDGDGRNDPAIVRAERGTHVLHARTRTGPRAARWGGTDSEPALADYDGDGRTDVTAWRPSDGAFAALLSAGGVLEARLGLPGDVPVPADYDGDGRAELALWRPSAHLFLVLHRAHPVPRSRHVPGG